MVDQSRGFLPLPSIPVLDPRTESLNVTNIPLKVFVNHLCEEFVPPVFPVFLDCLFIHSLYSIRGHGQLVQVHRGYFTVWL